MAGIEPFDTTLARNFGFEFDGNLFTEVQAISLGAIRVPPALAASNTSDGKSVEKKIPGKKEVPDVTITTYLTDRIKPIIESFEMNVMLGNLTASRKGAAIIAMDTMGTEVGRFELENAWVSSIQFGDFDAAGPTPGTVQVTFACEDIKVKLK